MSSFAVCRPLAQVVQRRRLCVQGGAVWCGVVEGRARAPKAGGGGRGVAGRGGGRRSGIAHVHAGRSLTCVRCMSSRGLDCCAHVCRRPLCVCGRGAGGGVGNPACLRCALPLLPHMHTAAALDRSYVCPGAHLCLTVPTYQHTASLPPPPPPPPSWAAAATHPPHIIVCALSVWLCQAKRPRWPQRHSPYVPPIR